MNKLSVLKKIYAFLHSDDLEMVQLGAVLVAGSVHRCHWKRIMRRWVDKIPDNSGATYFARNWTWQITREGIQIERVDNESAVNNSWGTTGTVGYSYNISYNAPLPIICGTTCVPYTGTLTANLPPTNISYGYAGSTISISP